jgi:tRNA-dihydrouridine synthase B
MSVQIAGNEPQMMAEAAVDSVERGADIIDINMGCPAKKVCNRAAGSALLRDEALVESILQAVVSAVEVPVTLKIRTGWNQNQKNSIRIARIAEDSGIQTLSIHGRTRADGFRGQAEYETIRKVCAQSKIPVIANGDIQTPEDASRILDYTGAAAVMIGRGAQGQPWIFREIRHYFETGTLRPGPTAEELKLIIPAHIRDMHAFYGPDQGVKIARKHIGWYLLRLPGGDVWRSEIMKIIHPEEQIAKLELALAQLINEQILVA